MPQVVPQAMPQIVPQAMPQVKPMVEIEDHHGL
jgi:hypothetical protein